jgi:hypothetical protein
MHIETKKLRKQYWNARFASSIYRHVGEGRTEAEAMGNLLLRAHEASDVHGLHVTRLPDSEAVDKPIGR